MGISEGDGRVKGENIGNCNDWEYSQINIRYQTTDPRSSGNTKKKIVLKKKKEKRRKRKKKRGNTKKLHLGIS